MSEKSFVFLVFKDPIVTLLTFGVFFYVIFGFLVLLLIFGPLGVADVLSEKIESLFEVKKQKTKEET